jgi:hypothetical protein
MQQSIPLPAAFSPLALTPPVAVGATQARESADPHRGEELSDADLEHVVGGLARVWTELDVSCAPS